LLKGVFMLYMTALAASVFLLAYSNGANDNFKGVATIYGSGTSSYDGALRYATIMTFLGSATAFFLAAGLVKAFSGAGLVGVETVAQPEFLFSVSLGAALTVLTATRLGLPVSTTHALVGGLIGAGLMSAGTSLNFGVLMGKFVVPLLLSPFIAIMATAAVYPVFSYLRRANGVTSESCVCVAAPAPAMVTPEGVVTSGDRPLVFTGDDKTCGEVYSGDIAGINAQTALNALHYMSAGAVSFARGLNDTPKILGLLAAVAVSHMDKANIVIVAAMALGGIISARRVGETMSKQITPMNHGQGFSANLVTSSVVIGASLIGAPVSTTHVSVGALFGLGMVNRSCRWNTLMKIFGSWVITLPVAIGFSAVIFLLFS